MKLSRFIAAAVVAMALTACPQRELPLPPGSRSAPDAPEPPQPPPALILELQRRIEADREVRQKLETRVVEQEKAKSQWQTRALLAVAGAVILLIVGAILGTRARHDAES